MKTPYQVRVVLQVAEHRMLTPQFHTQVESSLRDQLQLAFGKLAQVEVVRAHPLLADLRTKGLQRTLDAWDELSSFQTHFVCIDYAEGQYQIQTGHHDGMTGLSSPVVHREALGDRQRVADAAAQLVRQNFGVVGTFQKINGKEVRLAVKGGGLVDSLGTWVQRGDVFLVVRISEEGGKTRASPIEWAILQVVEALADGHVRCHYFCRYADDHNLSDGNGAAGYRCLRLRTVRGRVRVRLVNDKTNEYLTNLLVEASSASDFKSDLSRDLVFNGLFTAQGPFNHVAFVRVFTGKTPLVEFPVPLFDDRIVVCRMSPDENAIKFGGIGVRRDLWEHSQLQALSQADLRLGEWSATQNLDARLKLGLQIQQSLIADSDRFAKERQRLVEIGNKYKVKLDLSTGDQIAAALADRLKQLSKHVDELDAIIKEANSDETRELIATVKRAQLLESQADFDKAIELYEAVLKVRDSADIKTHLLQLKAAWAPKSPEHLQARQFLYTRWLNFDVTALKANFDEAEKSFQICKDAGDRMTPLKLQLVNIQHASALQKELAILNRAPDSQDNRTKIKAMTELVERLRVLHGNVTAWTAKDRGPAK